MRLKAEDKVVSATTYDTRFLNPKQTIDSLSFLESHMVACDVSSGSGGWTIPLAKKLENGKVYALDVKE